MKQAPEQKKALTDHPVHVLIMAIGYPATHPDALKDRDLAPRHRKPLREFVFGGTWKRPAQLSA